MSENLSLMPQFNLGTVRNMDANKLALKSESSYGPPETGEKFTQYFEKSSNNNENAPEPKESSSYSERHSKQTQQSDLAYEKPPEKQAEPPEQAEQNAAAKPQKSPAEKAEIAKDVETILNNPDLSVEEKIEALAELPEFSELSFDEKATMLSNILEGMPELENSFAAFLYDNEEVPLEQASLDQETLLDKTELPEDLTRLANPETEEETLRALEEESSTQDIVAVIQHIFQGDEKVQMPTENYDLKNELQISDIERKASMSPTDILPEGLKAAGQNDSILPEGIVMTEEDTVTEEQMLEEITTQDNLAVKSDTAVTGQASKENTPPSLDISAAKVTPEEILQQNGNNGFSSAQINSTQNNTQRTTTELRIATIPLKDNISMVVTKMPEAPNKIGINLEPAGMGEAELVIETKDNVVTAVIRAEKADVLDMIRKETASLERHLKDAGIDLGGSNLQFERQDSNERQDRNSEQTTISAGFEESATPLNGVPSDPQSLYQTLSSLDISKGVDVRL